MNAKQKRPRGRPPAGDSTMEQIAIRLPKRMLAMIDELRERRLEEPGRSDVIRELLADALQRKGWRAG